MSLIEEATMLRGTGLLVILALAVMGCTPEYTVQSTKRYSRELGLSNQYKVSRWHNRAIPRSSELLVAVSQKVAIDVDQLSQTVVDAFASGFARVERVSGYLPTAAARREAGKRRCNFLLNIQSIEVGAAIPQDASQDAEADKRRRFSQFKIEMVLVDVVSGHTVDRFVISANPSYANFLGADIKTLLAPPLSDLVQDLTGA